MGVEALIQIPFTRPFSLIRAGVFVKDILVDQLNVKKICVGPDFKFGYIGVGDVDLLERLRGYYCFTVQRIEFVYSNQDRVSSTRIRQEINKGDMKMVDELMGYPFQVSGNAVLVKPFDQILYTSFCIFYPPKLIDLPDDTYQARIIHHHQLLDSIVTISSSPETHNRWIEIRLSGNHPIEEYDEVDVFFIDRFQRLPYRWCPIKI